MKNNFNFERIKETPKPDTKYIWPPYSYLPQVPCTSPCQGDIDNCCSLVCICPPNIETKLFYKLFTVDVFMSKYTNERGSSVCNIFGIDTSIHIETLLWQWTPSRTYFCSNLCDQRPMTILKSFLNQEHPASSKVATRRKAKCVCP